EQCRKRQEVEGDEDQYGLALARNQVELAQRLRDPDDTRQRQTDREECNAHRSEYVTLDEDHRRNKSLSASQHWLYAELAAAARLRLGHAAVPTRQEATDPSPMFGKTAHPGRNGPKSDGPDSRSSMCQKSADHWNYR